MNFIPYYIDQYQKTRPPDLSDFSSDVRNRAMERLAGATFPSAKDEKYLYTKIAPIFDRMLRKPERQNELMQQLPGGIIAGSFSGMIKQYEHLYRHFFSHCEPSDDVLTNLNMMLSVDGFFLYVPAGVKSDIPIQLVNQYDGCRDTLIQPKHNHHGSQKFNRTVGER